MVAKVIALKPALINGSQSKANFAGMLFLHVRLSEWPAASVSTTRGMVSPSRGVNCSAPGALPGVIDMESAYAQITIGSAARVGSAPCISAIRFALGRLTQSWRQTIRAGWPLGRGVPDQGCHRNRGISRGAALNFAS